MRPQQHPSAPRHKNPQKLLDIYIRNNKKQALLVHSPPDVNLAHITRLIASRLRVPLEAQALFYNGQTVELGQGATHLHMEDRSIMHLVDRRSVTREITINIRRLRVPERQQFRIPSSQIIEDFIVRSIQDQEEVGMNFLVQAGRELDSRRSFAEELVEDQSELFCLHRHRDQAKKEAREGNGNKEENEVGQKVQHTEQKEEARLDNSSGNDNRASRSQSVSEGDISSTPNFKKKKTLEVPRVQQQHHDSQNGSFLHDHNQPQTGGESRFFNEGSSISEIVNESMQNPQNKRFEESGVMFNSAIIGLNNESSLHPRQPSAIQESTTEQPSSHEEEPISFSFDNKAPEMIAPDRYLTTLDRQEIAEVDESKEETFSRQINKKAKLPKIQEESQQMSRFSLDQVENHEFTDSHEMGMYNSRGSNKKSQGNNMILVQDEPSHDDDDSEVTPADNPHSPEKKEAFLPEVIEEASRSQEGFTSIKAPLSVSSSLEASLQPQTPKEIDFYLIDNEGGNEPAGSQLEDKDELQTNGGKGTSENFNSHTSSRMKDNQYGFGHFEKTHNPNRFSDYRQYNTREDLVPENSKSEHDDPWSSDTGSNIKSNKDKGKKTSRKVTFKEEPSKVMIGDRSEESSFQAFEVPSSARVQYTPSELKDTPGRSEVESNLLSSLDCERMEEPPASSKIDELNKLCSEIDFKPNYNKPQNAANQFKDMLKLREDSDKKDPDLKSHTSRNSDINIEMSTTKNNSLVSRGVNVRRTNSMDPSLVQGLKGIHETIESFSFEKMELKGSVNPFVMKNFESETDFQATSKTPDFTLLDLIYETSIPEEDYLTNLLNEIRLKLPHEAR